VAYWPIEINQSRTAYPMTKWSHFKTGRTILKMTCYRALGTINAASLDDAESDYSKMARTLKVGRLMRDLRLSVAGVALVLDLIEERDALERKLALIEI
jgi:hypothetical protein